MRTRTVAAFVLIVALGSAGCGRGGGNDPAVATAQDGDAKPSASPSASASHDPDAPLKFARCMRENGVSWFPDPGAGGQMTVRMPKGFDRKKLEAAHEACQKFMPDGGAPNKPNAEDLERARLMAKCMRENGLPNFPDPDPDGGMSIDTEKLGTEPGSPAWKKAEAACAQYGPKGEKHTEKRAGVSGGGVGA